MADVNLAKPQFRETNNLPNLERKIIILCQSGAGVEVLENKHYMAARFCNRHHFNRLCHVNPVCLFILDIHIVIFVENFMSTIE